MPERPPGSIESANQSWRAERTGDGGNKQTNKYPKRNSTENVNLPFFGWQSGWRNKIIANGHELVCVFYIYICLFFTTTGVIFIIIKPKRSDASIKRFGLLLLGFLEPDTPYFPCTPCAKNPCDTGFAPPLRWMRATQIRPCLYVARVHAEWYRARCSRGDRPPKSQGRNIRWPQYVQCRIGRRCIASRGPRDFRAF